MRILNKKIVLLVVLPWLSSCSNALYFYETEKISLTVEARPDSSQPVQGSLGFKQRVALVTPPKSENGGEALSSISSFRFKHAPEPNDPFYKFNPITIRTAFITGNAAACLDQGEAETAAMILSNAEIASHEDIATMIINRLKEKNPIGLSRLKELCKKSWNEYSKEELKELEKITKKPPYKDKQKLHEALCKSVEGN